MAGIGFKLKKIFQHDTYLDNLRGILFSTSIAGGPIFFSILCLIILGIFSTSFLSGEETNVFLVTVVYIFAFSLIATGLTQLLITRYLSDLIYINQATKILPTFTSVLTITVISQFLIGLPFLFFWDIDIPYKITALILFVTVGCIWQLMIFLSAVKNYRMVLIAFLSGLIASVVLAFLLGEKYQLAGYLHGYTIGQLIIMFILLGRILIEFKSPEKPQFDFLRYVKIMPHLVLIGLFYNAGIWIDKIIFWFSSQGQQINSFLYAFNDYDSATFFAYLTVVPSYTYFLVKVETDFYGNFRTFYQSILNKGSLHTIHEDKKFIAKSMKESFFGLVKLQGTVTLVCLLFSKQIAVFFKLPIMGTLILDKALIAVFLQMLLLTIIIFMLYFDIKSQVVFVTATFFVLNIIFTFITLQLGYVYYGYGYLFSCLFSICLGYVFLNNYMNDLEYHTFVNQPVA